MMNDERDVRTVLAAREEAIRERDAAAAVAVTSGEIVSFDLQPPLRFVGQEARDVTALEAWFGTWDGPVTSTLMDPEVVVAGAYAFAFGLNRLCGTSRDAGPIETWFRSTFVLRNELGQWRIVHEHHSYPMKMDGSNLAATDLKP